MSYPSMTPVIIIHGLWMHGVVMLPLARRIADAGFVTQRWSYPSMWLTLSENADSLAAFCRGLGTGRGGRHRIQIVAHSMGGLVSLRMLERHHDIDCARLVLIGTPYVDSHAAHCLARWPGGRCLLGRSIAEWLATPRPQPRSDCSLGLIGGTRALGLAALVARDLPRPHDGVVSVAETRVPGASAQCLLPVTHSGMLLSKTVAAHCNTFLRHGSFAGLQP